MNPTVLQISTWQGALGVAVILVGGGVAWGVLKNSVSTIKKILDDEIKPDLKNVRERFVIVEDRVKVFWKDGVAPATSPRSLNERGTAILNASGIKTIIDDKRNDLLAAVRERRATNVYDAEQAILSCVAEIPTRFPELVPTIKDGAFKTGADIATVLLVAGFYLRDLIFPDLGYSLTDLDKPKTP
jgi:hypothetical protein